MSLAAIIEVRRLNKVYDNGVHALKNVSFEARRGEFLVIIGLSGSGKSTLLRCINRLVEPTSGQVLLDGEDLTRLPTRELRLRRRRIGMVFQQFNLVKRKSVLMNVLSGRLGAMGATRSVLGLFSEADRARALECLDIVGLRDKASNRADELSGGQQQRVAIARTLMQDPDVLLADEPVASLDPATSHSVMKYLQTANRQFGKTILCNLHFLSLVREYGTRVIALRHGELVFEGAPDDIDEAWFKRIYGDEAVEVQID
mgnify:CR=1 FL=1